MAHKAPGKAFHKGSSIIELANMFPNDETAEKWFVAQRWPQSVCCSECGSFNVQTRTRPASRNPIAAATAARISPRRLEP